MASFFFLILFLSTLGNASEPPPNFSVQFSFIKTQPEIRTALGTIPSVFKYKIDEPQEDLSPRYRLNALVVIKNFLNRQIQLERKVFKSYEKTDVTTSELRNAHFIPMEPEQGMDIFIPEALENTQAIFGKIYNRGGLEYEGWIRKKNGFPFLGEDTLPRGIWKNPTTGEFLDLIQMIRMQRI